MDLDRGLWFANSCLRVWFSQMGSLDEQLSPYLGTC